MDFVLSAIMHAQIIGTLVYILTEFFIGKKEKWMKLGADKHYVADCFIDSINRSVINVLDQ